MEFKFEMGETIESARKEANRLLRTRLENTSNEIVKRLLASGKDVYGPQTEGLAHEILRKKAEEFVLSETFAKACDAILTEVWDEELRNAAKVLANSKSRKHLFNQEPVRKEPRQDDPTARWVFVSETLAVSDGQLVDLDYQRFTWAERQAHTPAPHMIWRLLPGQYERD